MDAPSQQLVEIGDDVLYRLPRGGEPVRATVVVVANQASQAAIRLDGSGLPPVPTMVQAVTLRTEAGEVIYAAPRGSGRGQWEPVPVPVPVGTNRTEA